MALGLSSLKQVHFSCFESWSATQRCGSYWLTSWFLAFVSRPTSTSRSSNVYICSYCLRTYFTTSRASYFWGGYFSIAYGWGEDILCAANWVSAIAHSWIEPSLWAFRHSISVSSSITTILTILLCLYLNTPTVHLLLYVLLFFIIWMFVMILDYVFDLDDMYLLWLIIMFFLYVLVVFELMCLYWDFDD